ncbi:Opsin, ultraviolet-sensitive [Araneus ventricosus]|uniref:Opsin, ultraviolet-sensitive n=1 Tax=Araneus ventricosus TaxID=182803 RepID=A0A4Y2DBF4_ARAVE|nr:Opsin, ultraviolet-sensitive [Araneus ventricosus]
MLQRVRVSMLKMKPPKNVQTAKANNGENVLDMEEEEVKEFAKKIDQVVSTPNPIIYPNVSSRIIANKERQEVSSHGVAFCCRTKRLRKPSNYLVINLAVTDVIMLHKIVIFIYNSFSGGPAAGPHWCTYYGLIGGLSGTSAIMSIAMMAVERFICVSRPLDPASRMTRNRALMIVIGIWVYAGIFSFMPFFGINAYVPEGFLTSCSFDYLTDEVGSQIFVYAFFVAAWCVPMVIVCRCYIGIVKSVWDSQKVFMHHSQNFSGYDRNVENQRRLEIKLAKISFSLISLWTLSWTPYAIVALIGLSRWRYMLTPFGSMIPALFCKMASVLDPFVYGLSNRQFKGELMRKLLLLCKSRKLQDRQRIPSFIRRAMSVKSQGQTISEEQAEVSFSEAHAEIPFNETFVHSAETKEEELKPPADNSDIPLRTFHTNYNTMRRADNVDNTDPELNNNVEFKIVHFINIPQVYIMKVENDIIKLKTRRSF